MSKKALGNYQKVQTTTATPIQRVLLVYNGIIKNLNLAIAAFDTEDPTRFESINNNVQLAERLIHELNMALDKERGGELALQLNSLYTFWVGHLSRGNRAKSKKNLEEVLHMVQELNESWQQLEQQMKNGQAENGNQ